MKKVVIILAVILGFAFSANSTPYFGLNTNTVNLHLKTQIYHDQTYYDNARVTCFIASGGFLVASLLKQKDYYWVNDQTGAFYNNGGNKGYWKTLPFYKDPGKILPFATGIVCLGLGFYF